MATKSPRRRRRFGTVIKRLLPTGSAVFKARWNEGRSGARRERNFPSRDQALEFLAEIERRLISGTYVTPHQAREVEPAPAATGTGTPDFVTYAKQVLRDRIAPARAEATVDLYQHNLAALDLHFGPRAADRRKLAAKRLDEITKTSFLDYRAWRLRTPRTHGGGRTGVSHATVNREQQFASLVLNHAVQDGLLASNPLAGLKKLPERKTHRRWLSKIEAAKLIDSCDPHFRPYVLTALYTGCRPGELKALRWEDIDFDNGKVHVIRRKVGNADALDLHPHVADEFRRLRASRGHVGPQDHVFLNRKGSPWRDMRRAWRQALKAAGLEGRTGLSPYSLRHTLATHFLEDGGVITDLQAQLGHAQVSTTQIYAALVNERRRSSVLRLDFGDATLSDGTGQVGEVAQEPLRLLATSQIPDIPHASEITPSWRDLAARSSKG